MSERCRESCPIIALVGGEELFCKLIVDGMPKKYLSHLDTIERAEDPDPELVASIVDKGPGVAEVVEIADGLSPEFINVIANAIELCPGLEVEAGATVGSSIIKCSGFSVKSIAGLLDGHHTFARAVRSTYLDQR